MSETARPPISRDIRVQIPAVPPPSDARMKEETQTSPGSKEAHAAGCRCPILDNAYGKGYMGMEGIFVVNGECPIHGENVKARPNDKVQPSD
jgi:hypothetical protein